MTFVTVATSNELQTANSAKILWAYKTTIYRQSDSGKHYEWHYKYIK